MDGVIGSQNGNGNQTSFGERIVMDEIGEYDYSVFVRARSGSVSSSNAVVEVQANGANYPIETIRLSDGAQS